MKSENPVRDKSYAFALRIVMLYRMLSEEKREFVLSKQVLRSGTSIGANIEEALGGQSGKDFQSKLLIAYKEARETLYWLRLLHDSGYIDDKTFDSLSLDCNELLRLLGSITKSMKEKLNNSK
ncbi:MAG: four helix bundle protein [Lentisphaerota bacterium]